MNTYLFAAPKFQPLDATGALMPASYVQFYLTGTTTPTDVYADADMMTPLANPVVADSDGVFPFIYMDGSITYRAQFYDSADVLQWDVDPYAPPRDYPAGTVLMFMGDATARDAAYPPALWQVCDGSNGTYDMRGRIPIGVSASIDPGEEVGTDAGGTATTSPAGAHDHGGAVDGTSLTAAMLPAHQHFVAANVIQGTPTDPSASNYIAGETTVGGDTEYDLQGTATAATVGLSSSIGSGNTHAHDITEQSAHTHDLTTVLPPCTGIWFVCRKA